MAEEHNHPEPLKRHSYPIWIVLFALLVVALTLYSFTLLPKYMNAANVYKQAQQANRDHNSESSIDKYLDVIKKVPSSKNARIGLAEVVFSDNDPGNDDLGMLALEGIRLKTSEWNRLKSVIPQRYLPFFK